MSLIGVTGGGEALKLLLSMHSVLPYSTLVALARDLHRINVDAVYHLVQTLGLYDAARVLGYNVSHYDNLEMSGRLVMHMVKQEAPPSILEYSRVMAKRLNPDIFSFIQKHAPQLQSAIDENSHLDYRHDWFSANTMLTTYLARPSRSAPVAETPQYLYMRVAVQLYYEQGVEAVLRCYREMSQGLYTPASPTIFNAGMRHPQMASCFVAGTPILTERGVVTIDTVEVGDTVTTHLGRTKTVSQLHTNALGDRQLYRLQGWNSQVLLVTDNHCLWARTSTSVAGWVPVSALTQEHFLALPARNDEGAIDLPIETIMSIAQSVAQGDPTPLQNPEAFFWSKQTVSELCTKIMLKSMSIGAACGSLLYYISRNIGIIACDPSGAFPTNVSPDNYHVWDGVMYVRVLSCAPNNARPDTVYNIGVDDDHSYCIGGFVAQNCFLLTIEDNLDSILKHGIYNAGVISKHSGGLGIDVSRIRHSEIGDVGMSNGIVPMLQTYNAVVRYVDQGGGFRKGAATVYLRPHHLDIYEFVNLVDQVGDANERTHDLDTCIWFPWIFWERLQQRGKWTLFCPARTTKLNDLWGEEFSKAYIAAENDPTILPHHKRVVDIVTLYDHIVNIQIKASRPFVMHADACNLKSNQRHLGYIRSGNLCVTGDTLLLTKEGYFPIATLKDTVVQVWNGDEFSPVTVKKTGENRQIVQVVFTNGQTLSCTLDHRFLLYNDAIPTIADKERVTARSLVPGTRLHISTLPVIESQCPDPFPHAYTHGVLTARGGSKGDSFCLELLPEEKEILQRIERNGDSFPHDLLPMGEVPLNASLKDKLAWFAGVLDGRGYVNSDYAVFVHRSYDLLWEMQMLLTTLGCRPTISDDSPIFLPRQGGQPLYSFALLLPWEEYHKLVLLGLETYRFVGRSYSDDKDPDTFLEVKAVLHSQRLEDTFCFVEEKNHAGVFNGILTSNCLEVVEHTDADSIAACNLSSISLRAFVRKALTHEEKDTAAALRDCYDFLALGSTTRRVTENLNQSIDHNFYPLDESPKEGSAKKGPIHKSNEKHRPLGIGASGFADTLHGIDLPFEDDRTRLLNKMIFACMYWNGLAQSVQLAIRDGAHASFAGSPFSQGKLQFDLWREEFLLRGPNPLRKEEDDNVVDPTSWGQDTFHLYTKEGDLLDIIEPSWDDLKRVIVKYGTRNSLILALMPTASTAQTMRNCESCEAHQSNLYSRKVLNGSYPVINRYLQSDLGALGLWNEGTVRFLMEKQGSIQGFGAHIESLASLRPDVKQRVLWIEKKYKTMWELSQRIFLVLAAERGRYIDQSQSTNIFLANPTTAQVGALHLMTHQLGLKTGMYYLRQNPMVKSAQFSVSPDLVSYVKDSWTGVNETSESRTVCTKEVCLQCQ